MMYLLGIVSSSAVMVFSVGFVGVAVGCQTTIDGPIPAYVDVSRGHWFDGDAKTRYTWRSCGEPTYHFVDVWGTFKTANYYNHNGYWKVWFNDGVLVNAVTLDDDEWIADGGVGYNYVVIGQFAGQFYFARYRNPAVYAEIPSSLYGEDIHISMYVSDNGWDCSQWWITKCGGTQTYILTG